MEGATILHVDLDAFYASVEERRDPSLTGTPFVVGGGVVLSPSYEARRFGVRSGMGTRQARQLCPGLVVVRGEFHDYGDASDEVFEICRRFSPIVEQVSIDEAFLDVSGSTHLFGPSEVIARDLKKQVLDETRLVVSIGVARTKHLAKVGSQVAKPNGIVVIDPRREDEFLHPLPVRYLWGIGPATESKLADRGIHTIGDLAATGDRALARWLGAGIGPGLYALAHHQDPRRVVTTRRAKSIGSQSAFGGDVHDRERWDRILLSIADRVSRRLRAKGLAAMTITARVRFSDMASVTRSHTGTGALSTSEGLFVVGRRLVHTAVDEAANGRGLSLIGLSCSNLRGALPQQLELTLDQEDALIRPGTIESQRRFDIDLSVDAVRKKFGRDMVGRASVLLQANKDAMVPEEFRELAQFKE